jgi:hypothetical protein
VPEADGFRTGVGAELDAATNNAVLALEVDPG